MLGNKGWNVPGLAWGRVNFLHNGSYQVTFLICAEYRVNDMEIFLLLLNSACTEPRPFMLLVPPYQWITWGCARSWEGTQTGQLTPNDHRDIPDHMVSCSAYRTWGRGRGGTFGVMEFFFPSHHYVWQNSAFLRMVEHLPVNAKWWTNSLFWFACT